MTYGGQDVAKIRVNKSEHAIGYTAKYPPTPQSEEAPKADERPMRNPIRVRPDKKFTRLDQMARIDYGRVYTVEHNVQVMAFGWVHEHSLNDLNRDFLHVFLGEDGYREMLMNSVAQSETDGRDSDEYVSNRKSEHSSEADSNVEKSKGKIALSLHTGKDHRERERTTMKVDRNSTLERFVQQQSIDAGGEQLRTRPPSIPLSKADQLNPFEPSPGSVFAELSHSNDAVATQADDQMNNVQESHRSARLDS